MANTTKVMSNVQKEMDTEKLKSTLMEFEKQNAKMTMREEMIQDALIDEFDEEEEEEHDAIMDQVLAEVGIDLGALMVEAPNHQVAPTETVASSTGPKQKLASDHHN